MTEIVNMSMTTIIRALNSQTLPEQFKAELASKFAIKILPDKSLQLGDSDKNIIYVISGTDKKLEDNSEQILPSRSTEQNQIEQSQIQNS